MSKKEVWLIIINMKEKYYSSSFNNALILETITIIKNNYNDDFKIALINNTEEKMNTYIEDYLDLIGFNKEEIIKFKTMDELIDYKTKKIQKDNKPIDTFTVDFE